MDFQKFKQILSKFSKNEIENFLGNKIVDSILEYSSSPTQRTKDFYIDVLINNDGFSILKKKDFRVRFFKSLSERELRYILNDNDSEKDIGTLAKDAASKNFQNNQMYSRLIKDLLGCTDYKFEEFLREEGVEIATCPNEKFYELLDYQYYIKQQILYEILKPGKIGRKILIHMPTGTGKTKTTMHAVCEYLNNCGSNKTVIWIAHTNILLEQALKTFRNVWNHLGKTNVQINKSWGRGNRSINNGIYFITIESLISMRKKNINLYNHIKEKTNLVVYDECHKIGASKTALIVKEFTKSTNTCRKDMIGLTATPGRTTNFSQDNKYFREFFDRIIEINPELLNRLNMGENAALNQPKSQSVIKYFQNRRVLSKLTREELTYNVDQDLKDSIVKELMNDEEDFSPTLVNKISENRARNEAILNRLRQLNNQNIPTIVFACSVLHAKMLSAFLNMEGIKNSLVYGEMQQYLKDAAIDDFSKGRVNIIINFDVLTTGFDSTNIRCVFIARPTKSVILYSQMIGRGLRGPRMGGNEQCLLIDVKDNLDKFDVYKAFDHFKDYWR